MRNLFNRKARSALHFAKRTLQPSLLLGTAMALFANLGGEWELALAMAGVQLSLAVAGAVERKNKRFQTIKGFLMPASFGLSAVYYGALTAASLPDVFGAVADLRNTLPYTVTAFFMSGFYAVSAINALDLDAFKGRLKTAVKQIKDAPWSKGLDIGFHGFANLAFALVNSGSGGGISVTAGGILPLQRIGVTRYLHDKVITPIFGIPKIGELYKTPNDIAWEITRERSAYMAMSVLAYCTYSSGLDIDFSQAETLHEAFTSLLAPGSQGNLLVANGLAMLAFGINTYRESKALNDLKA